MTSNIIAIYNAIEGMGVTFTDNAGASITPTIYDRDELESSLQASATPARLLLPYSDAQAVTATMADFVIGNTSTITWTLIDRFVWRPIGHGAGLRDAAVSLTNYIGAYMDAVIALDFSGITDLITVESVTCNVNDFMSIPAGTDNVYVGVDAIWTLLEDDPI